MLWFRINLVMWLCCALMMAAEPRAACAECGAYILEGQSHASSCSYAPRPSGGSSRPNTAHLSSEDALKLQLTQSLLDGFINGMAEADAREQAAAEEARRQAEAQRRAEEEARRLAALEELRRLNGLVQGQRLRRDAENQTSLEGLSSALGAGFDTPLPAGPLISDPMVVDLRDRRGWVLPGMDPPPPPTTKAEQHDARAAAAQRDRLRRMAEEADDAKALLKRLTELEARLVKARARLVALKRDANRLRRDFDSAREDVEAAVAAATEQGMGLALAGLSHLHGKGLERVQQIHSDSALWNETVRSANGVNELLGKIRQTDDDYTWLTAERNPVKDLDYLAERFDVLGPHYQVGKAIVGSSVSLWREWKAAKTIAAGQQELREVEEQRRRESAAQQALMSELHAARAALAHRLGLPLSDVPLADPAPPKPRGIGSHVPHPYD